MAFGLAKEFKILDPFKMLEEMPDALFQYWQAYHRLRDPDYRQQADWDRLKEADEAAFKEEQEQAALGIIRLGKAQTAARSRRKPKT